jgi:hypothetical protein
MEPGAYWIKWKDGWHVAEFNGKEWWMPCIGGGVKPERIDWSEAKVVGPIPVPGNDKGMSVGNYMNQSINTANDKANFFDVDTSGGKLFARIRYDAGNVLDNMGPWEIKLRLKPLAEQHGFNIDGKGTIGPPLPDGITHVTREIILYDKI